MSSPSPSDDAPPQPSIPPSDRIRDLSAIDAEIPKLLASAGHAIKSLTGDAAQPAQSGAPPLDAAKAAFATHNTAYLHTLQGIGARLRRQAYALEEAGIIAPTGTAVETSAPPASQGQKTPAAAAAAAATAMQVTNGGLGGFDVGWLNSRRDDVGAVKEAELWREAREFLEGVAAERNDRSGGS